ncbi:hypothetical protein Btru_008292 [Bulinus truncatus]|nr:hypothetical protein Btru_008292 [Bulinus truncatus]
MHYEEDGFFSINEKPTILTKDPKFQKLIGMSERLSFFDIKQANLLYRCGDSCPAVQCPDHGFVGKDCKCWCQGDPVRLCDHMYEKLFDLLFGLSVFSFPLKSCSTDNQILFVIDCRHEVREQIVFINQTVDYLRYYRNWTLVNVSFMTYEDKEPTSPEVLTANITEKANEESNQCNGTISVNELFLNTNLAIRIKHSILRLIVIFFKYRRRKNGVNSKDCGYFYIPHLQIIEIQVQDCKIQNVDKALRHWEKTQTVILDLSRNQISNSDDLRSVTTMTTLLFLNLSRNVQLSINDKFEFPYTLEVIDLSYTSVESLPEKVFGPLHSLRMLDLSYTKIHKFENMGLPWYFTLDILNIEGVMITEITADFYKGLTVNTSLMFSDFKLCCPHSGKCLAPDDAISSCKHLVGDTLKRILVWVVGLLTIAGNGIVLIYRVVWSREKIFQTAYGLFVTGLAVSDLLMVVYLMIIAVVDVVYADVYVVYDESWRKSFLCNFSGFLSTLSSETSTFLIGLITLHCFMSISYPFSAIDTSTSHKWKGFISTWVVGFVVALIPAVVPEWQIYSSNGLSLTLPLSTKGCYKLPGWEFFVAVYVK